MSLVSRGTVAVDDVDEAEDMDEERRGNADSCMLLKDTMDFGMFSLGV
jgi:hypothetical protein